MNVEKYVRTPAPVLQESQIRYLQDELRKLERVLDTIYDALKEVDTRLKAGNL